MDWAGLAQTPYKIVIANALAKSDPPKDFIKVINTGASNANQRLKEQAAKAWEQSAKQQPTAPQMGEQQPTAQQIGEQQPAAQQPTAQQPPGRPPPLQSVPPHSARAQAQKAPQSSRRFPGFAALLRNAFDRIMYTTLARH